MSAVLAPIGHGRDLFTFLIGAVSAPTGLGRDRFICPIGAISAPIKLGFNLLGHGFGKRFLTFAFEPLPRQNARIGNIVGKAVVVNLSRSLPASGVRVRQLFPLDQAFVRQPFQRRFDSAQRQTGLARDRLLLGETTMPGVVVLDQVVQYKQFGRGQAKLVAKIGQAAARRLTSSAAACRGAPCGRPSPSCRRDLPLRARNCTIGNWTVIASVIFRSVMAVDLVSPPFALQ